MDVPEIKVCGICGRILLRRDRSHGPANCPTVSKMDVPEIKVCGSATIQNVKGPTKELSSMAMARSTAHEGQVMCYGSTKILDMRKEEKSARRAIQKREIGLVNVTLNDPAVVVTGTILGPNPGEEKQIIYYDDAQNK